MPEKMERPLGDKTSVGLEVVSGLERTLEWMRSQFDGFRTDVGLVKTATPPHVITASANN